MVYDNEWTEASSKGPGQRKVVIISISLEAAGACLSTHIYDVKNCPPTHVQVSRLPLQSLSTVLARYQSGSLCPRGNKLVKQLIRPRVATNVAHFSVPSNFQITDPSARVVH